MSTISSRIEGLITEARQIAGCGWDDYAPDGAPDQKCLACADSAPLGADGDYTDTERARLREIAAELEYHAGYNWQAGSLGPAPTSQPAG